MDTIAPQWVRVGEVRRECTPYPNGCRGRSRAVGVLAGAGRGQAEARGTPLGDDVRQPDGEDTGDLSRRRVRAYPQAAGDGQRLRRRAVATQAPRPPADRGP